MGVQTMENEVVRYAKEFGSAAHCSTCDGITVPMSKTILREYKGEDLILQNFPIMKCLSCDTESYSAGSLIKHLKLAKYQYDLTGEVMYDCRS